MFWHKHINISLCILLSFLHFLTRVTGTGTYIGNSSAGTCFGIHILHCWGKQRSPPCLPTFTSEHKVSFLWLWRLIWQTGSSHFTDEDINASKTESYRNQQQLSVPFPTLTALSCLSFKGSVLSDASWTSDSKRMLCLMLLASFPPWPSEHLRKWHRQGSEKLLREDLNAAPQIIRKEPVLSAGNFPSPTSVQLGRTD